MAVTRSRKGGEAGQKALEQLPSVSVKRKTGGGRRANQVPKEEAAPHQPKRSSPQETSKDAAASSRHKRSKAQPPEATADQEGRHGATAPAPQDAKAVADSIDTTAQAAKSTKQAGLAGGSSGDAGGGGGGAEPATGGHSAGGSGDGGGELALDKKEHQGAGPNPKSAAAEAAQKTKAAKRQAEEKPGKIVKINRAPVLTLWVKKVAQREGYDEEAALTFGRSISGLLAQSRGRAIGIFDPRERTTGETAQSSDAETANVFGMEVKVVKEGDSIRATGAEGKAISPRAARDYLKRAFGEDLEETEAALGRLAAAFSPKDVGSNGYRLYENFRPTVAAGQQGWGQKADLDLGLITALADQQ